jgi:Leucine-rich repeat (LRR) protein
MKLKADLLKSFSHKNGQLVIYCKDYSSIAKDCFVGYNHLKRLELTNNQSLKAIKCKAFKGLINLEILDLSNNQISRISKSALKGLKSLVGLNLGNNQIDKLTLGSFDDQKKSNIIGLVWQQVALNWGRLFY